MDQLSTGLADPEHAAHAWGRFRAILKWMALVAVLVSALAVWLVGQSLGEFYWSASIATAAGTFFTVMMAAALMGLVFLSSGTGHDEQVEDPLKGEIDLD
ncbi:hypothetical protein ACFQ1E_15700 [Sphingomonas canadensis]|uniref:Uncharacterized protein n=1 Tax=Sphingomonas canadensis TaxID=1219257 RepID=A0ABW3HAF0_9SPHN|nr:hypothetical protein [Sphingomonas canadensis]MCW3837353.1 hypothetical protein [Sphingomonas canadensis]